jgi:UDP-N-acetylglucosamine acyltransferase
LIHPTAVIGDPPEQRGFDGPEYPPLIDPAARIEAYCTVDAGTEQRTQVSPGAWLMKGCHVGHDAVIGFGAELAPHCSVGGHAVIGNHVRVGQGALFKPYVKVGDGARIGMGSVVISDVPEGEVWAGNPARRIHPAPSRMTELEEAGWEDWWQASRPASV